MRLPAASDAYRLAWRGTRHLPAPVGYGLAHSVADALWVWQRLRRSTAGVGQLERNLARILPAGTPPRALRRATRAGMRSYMRYFYEAFALPGITPEQILARVRTDIDPQLHEDVRVGSVVMALPHMGNWDLIGAWACRELATVLTVAERLEVTGAILQADDGVLVHNRLARKIPIVDEVRLIEKVPLGMLAAIEVADVGRIVETLSNPFGIATLFGLEADATRSVVPLARSLVGNRSAVVIKTPEGDVQERRIPAGRLTFHGTNTLDVDVDLGAAEIMDVASRIRNLSDITGEAGTNVGGMMEKVRVTMAQLTNQHTRDIRITDLLAVDTRVPQQVAGGIANEFSMEAAVGIAVMVRTDRLQMERIASELAAEIGVPVEVGGVEADMAIRGALTTPGTAAPIAILDMGAGSTDASVMRPDGTGTSIHLAGAGNMVTLMIQSELGLDSFDLAEDIKRHPLAKVESVFNIRHEDGTVQFFEDPLPGHVYARTVVLKPDGMVPLDVDLPVETIRQVRIRAKEQVFVTNAIRALQRVSPTSEVRGIDFVVLVGGSALDFEIPQLVTRALADYRVVAGRANIRGVEGPRNAVATGLVLGGES